MQQNVSLEHCFSKFQNSTEPKLEAWSARVYLSVAANAQIDDAQKLLNSLLPADWQESSITSGPWSETYYEMTWRKAGGFELYVYFVPPEIDLRSTEAAQVHIYLAWLAFSWACDKKKLPDIAAKARQYAQELNLTCADKNEVQAIVQALKDSQTKDAKGWKKVAEACNRGRAVLLGTVEGELHYHDCFVFGTPRILYEHHGKLGEVGTQTSTPVLGDGWFQYTMLPLLKPSYDRGYRLVPKSRYKDLTLVFACGGSLGSEAELALRHAMEESLDELLGRTCLGSVDGGSIGSGTMEIFCEVIEPKLAELRIRAHIRELFGREILRIEIDN